MRVVTIGTDYVGLVPGAPIETRNVYRPAVRAGFTYASMGCGA